MDCISNEEESFTMEKDFCSVLIVRSLIYLFWELSYKTRINIHKFNAKPKTISPKTIHWRPLRQLKYPPQKVNSTTWEIFSQEEIKLEPREVKQLQLGLGFMMSEGVVLDRLYNSLKYKRCSLQNKINLEDAEDIVITLMNNSRSWIFGSTNFYVMLKKYNSNNKTEMKENLYPKLPTAPPFKDQGQGYRLQKINELQAFLEKEVATREALSKKYFRAAGIVDNMDTV